MDEEFRTTKCSPGGSEQIRALYQRGVPPLVQHLLCCSFRFEVLRTIEVVTDIVRDRHRFGVTSESGCRDVFYAYEDVTGDVIECYWAVSDQALEGVCRQVWIWIAKLFNQEFSRAWVVVGKVLRE